MTAFDVTAFDVTYDIYSLIGDDSPVASGSVTVQAVTDDEARAAAAAWAHEHDPHADPRIDPVIRVTACDEAVTDEPIGTPC